MLQKQLKRHGFIYEKIYDIDNLRLAHKEARKDKSFYKEVKMVDSNPDYYLKQIQDLLKNKTYRVSAEDYTMFKKNDKGKIREIYKLDYFPHRIIQWAIMLQIQDIMFNNLIRNTFSSLPTRGIHDTLRRLDSDLKSYEDETQYCLKIDIEKFYPNVNHRVLKQQFRRKFKDPDLLWLLDMLIDSLGGLKGIAIGSLFSQWGGNYNLSPFDHWMKEVKKVKFYYRYCDDFVILSDNKQELHDLLKDIKVYLKDNLDLKVKDNYQIFPVDRRGIDFVGYRHFRSYILLRKSISKDLIRAMRDIKKKIDRGGKFSQADYSSIDGYKGWLKWADGHNLYKRWIEPLMPHYEEYYREVIKGENISRS